MTKEKSKQIKQLRYLLLVPVLFSMLFYTACTDDQTKETVVAKKEFSKLYFEFEDGLKISEGEKESYLDHYSGTTSPNKNGWNEISYNDLLMEEKLEYDDKMNKVKKIRQKYSEIYTSKLYEKPDGRRVMCDIIDFSRMKKYIRNVNEDGSIPFALLDKAPTYPGCPEGDKDCFNKKMEEYVRENFDTSLTKNLGLSSGKNKIYVQFKINKDGSITNLKARAPHPSLKEHAIKMMDKLPKLKPGLQKGKAVRVGYTLPISFIVE